MLCKVMAFHQNALGNVVISPVHILATHLVAVHMLVAASKVLYKALVCLYAICYFIPIAKSCCQKNSP